MTILPDQAVIELAQKAASENGVSVSNITTTTTTAVDTFGTSAVEIKVVITPGSSANIMGMPSALTTSQIVRQLADRGEERSPIVRYEEEGAARP